MTAPALQDRVAPQHQAAWDAHVRAWLVFVAFLVLCMIVVGGTTRLTDSGLSITEWQPLLGAIPPLNDAHWLDAFEKYKQIPEYHLVNKGMSLDEFKFIYWWEWSHRFLGRFIGLAVALPFAVFWLRGALRPGYAAKLLCLLALGGFQGAIGWYMVKSGLVDRVDVSHYRLALHLTVAFVILAWVTWLASELAPWPPHDPALGSADTTRATALLGLVLAQVVLGAFVAGLKAGLVYNTWPLMDGQFLPDDILAMQPWYVNLVENATTAQFNHRLVAYVLLGLAFWQAVALSRRAGGAAFGSAALLAAGVVAQAALGIWTLLRAVPIGLGVTHQGMAAVVLMLAVRHVHAVRRAQESSTIRRAPASV